MADSTDPMGGTVAGSADLQQSMDRLDGAVNNLTTAINRQSNGNGTSTSPAMASGASGATFTTGTYAGAGGGSANFMGGITGGNNGSGGTSGTNPFSFSNLFSGGNLAQAAVNIGSSVVNGQFAAGAQQLNNQATINTYGYTQAGFWNASSKSAITNAFGGGSGSNLTSNNLATSASDARNGAAILSQLSDQSNYTAAQSGQYGRGNAAFQLATTTGMSNPGLGMTGSAGIASAFYNPSTSYNLMMMGVGTTPLQLGTGKQNSITGVESAIGNRFGFQGYNAKTGTFNSQNLAANLYNPLFEQQIMQATGMNQQDYQTWAQQWAQTNTWALNGKTSTSAVQNDIAQYMNPNSGAKGQASALDALKKIPGFNMSLLQSMTQSNALQTGAEAGGNAAFTKGLQDATNAVNQFTAALSGGLQQMAGTTGAAGAIGSLNTSGVVGAGSGATSAGIGSAISAIQSGLTDLSHLSGLNNLGGMTGSGSTAKGAANTGYNMGSASGGSAKANQALGQKMAAAMGWTGVQWTDLNNVMMNESGWITDNQNPTSTAFGIGQFLDSTWGEYDSITKAQAKGNAKLQIQAMLDYVKGRYGNPANAWNGYFNRYGPGKNGYADGTTSAKPGMALVGERGPELVSLSGGQQIINAAQTARMLQPKYGGQPAQSSGGGLHITFANGAITMHNTNSGTTGYHTSGDVQSNAAQLVQAVETALNKSQVLKNIAAGVTG